ncbi:MAG: hypothetical protein K2X08_06350 [Chlamydiales bacterium]|nr:hypothetical protein [Chlamydiales bacterium]
MANYDLVNQAPFYTKGVRSSIPECFGILQKVTVGTAITRRPYRDLIFMGLRKPIHSFLSNAVLFGKYPTYLHEKISKRSMPAV